MAKKETKKPEKVKEKKGKNKKGEQAQTMAGVPPTGQPSVGAGQVPPTGQPSVPLSAMSPEQMTVAQLEQAIKESNDPESRLKKLHSPLSVKSCLLNLLFLIILTLGIVILWCFLAVDKFNFVTVVTDMCNQFGITKFFQSIGTTISGWFH